GHPLRAPPPRLPRLSRGRPLHRTQGGQGGRHSRAAPLQGAADRADGGGARSPRRERPPGQAPTRGPLRLALGASLGGGGRGRRPPRGARPLPGAGGGRGDRAGRAGPDPPGAAGGRLPLAPTAAARHPGALRRIPMGRPRGRATGRALLGRAQGPRLGGSSFRQGRLEPSAGVARARRAGQDPVGGAGGETSAYAQEGGGSQRGSPTGSMSQTSSKQGSKGSK